MVSLICGFVAVHARWPDVSVAQPVLRVQALGKPLAHESFGHLCIKRNITRVLVHDFTTAAQAHLTDSCLLHHFLLCWWGRVKLLGHATPVANSSLARTEKLAAQCCPFYVPPLRVHFSFLLCTAAVRDPPVISI